jgi:hypothetical protein
VAIVALRWTAWSNEVLLRYPAAGYRRWSSLARPHEVAVAAAESSVVAAHPVQENLRGELQEVFHCSSACSIVHSVQLDASDTPTPSRSDLRLFT